MVWHKAVVCIQDVAQAIYVSVSGEVGAEEMPVGELHQGTASRAAALQATRGLASTP